MESVGRTIMSRTVYYIPFRQGSFSFPSPTFSFFFERIPIHISHFQSPRKLKLSKQCFLSKVSCVQVKKKDSLSSLSFLSHNKYIFIYNSLYVC